MNKKWYILLIILLVIGISFGIYYFSQNNNINISYDTNKVSTTTKNNNNNDNNSNYNNNEEQPQNPNTPNDINPEKNKKEPVFEEEELSNFSTKILSDDSARQNNIEITCKALNDKIIKKGETFSFCNTIGPSTTGKGYKKADIFDKDGNKKKGLGGGNCQISSTLYNAVLNCEKLKVTERHEHSNKVPYVKKGKDATVAYGSYDFKFINNYDFDIKIKCSTNGKTVNVSIIGIKPT